MTTHTTVRSWPAMCLAIFFAAATGYVLLEDVFAGQPFTIAHLGAIAALVAAFAAGHYWWPAIRHGALVAGVILCIVFVGASGYVLLSTGMRNAEQSAGKSAGAAKSADDLARARETWQRLHDQLAAIPAARTTTAVRAAMDAVVGKGDGQVPVRVFRATRECTDILKPTSAEACRPLLALRVEMASAISRAELEPKLEAARQRLAGLRPVVAPETGYAYAARVIAAIPGVSATPAAIQERLELLMPFLRVLIGEAGGLGFGYLALGHRPAAPPAAATPVAASAAPASPAIPDSPKPAPTGPGKGRRGRKPDANVVQFATAFREKHGRAPGGSDLMRQFPEMPKSTAYDYAKRA